MGIYLVDIEPDSWARDSLADDFGALLDGALAERGLGPYPGPARTVPPSERFEEKISRPLEAFTELCGRHGVPEVLDAFLFVPVPFGGLITLPAGNAFDESETHVVSSQWLRDAIAPMAAEIGLPADLPTGDLALTNSIEDPVTFYVAVYRQAAEHSLRYDCPLTYV